MRFTLQQFVLLASIFFVAIRAHGQDLSQPELDAQLKKWSNMAIADYDFVMARSCFCFPDYTRPGLVQVRSGAIAAVQDPATMLPLDPSIYLTIDQLFDQLQNAIDDNAVRIDVTFEEALAYPATMYIDTHELLADEEVGYSASGLTTELTEIGCSFENPRPCAGDFIDELANAIRTGNGDLIFDINSDWEVTANDIIEFVEQDLNTFFGDSNLDGEFNSGDMVHVMQAAQYEDAIAENSRWDTGDWNGDREFDSSDWVLAMSRGNYEKGPRRNVRAVPEPCTQAALFWAAACLLMLVRGRKI